MKKIKGMLVRANGDDRIQEYELEYDGIDSIYNLLDIRCFDIPERMIGEHWYDIYCDDEALLKDPIPNRTFITLNDRGQIVEKIYGNIFICKHDRNGGIKGLTKSELNEIWHCSMHTYIMGHLDF